MRHNVSNEIKTFIDKLVWLKICINITSISCLVRWKYFNDLINVFNSELFCNRKFVGTAGLKQKINADYKLRFSTL